jgi:hypothetical protein
MRARTRGPSVARERERASAAEVTEEEPTTMYETKAYSAAGATSPLAATRSDVNYRFAIDMASLAAE